jgi:hypothetical protein
MAANCEICVKLRKLLAYLALICVLIFITLHFAYGIIVPIWLWIFMIVTLLFVVMVRTLDR